MGGISTFWAKKNITYFKKVHFHLIVADSLILWNICNVDFFGKHFHWTHNFQTCFWYANVLKTSTFNSNNSNISNIIKIQHCQIMTTITNIILELKPMIKNSVMADNTLFTVTTLNRINSFIWINSIITQYLYNPLIKIKNVILIIFKKMVIKMIYYLFVYIFKAQFSKYTCR